MTMKILTKGLQGFAVAALLLVALPASAATVSGLSPTTVSVEEGETFTVSVSFDPAGDKNYTVRAALSFPSKILEATGFSFNSAWLPVSQDGYDEMGPGTLIKTGGYPGGFDSETTLGTATFRAKQAGTATISFTNDSFAYNNQSVNVLTTKTGSSVTVVAPVAPEPEPESSEPEPEPEADVEILPATTEEDEEPASEEEEETTATTTGTTTATAAVASTTGNGLLAAVADVISLGTGNALLGALVILLLLVAGGYGWMRYGQGLKNKVQGASKKEEGSGKDDELPPENPLQ
ncbi:MAG: cohesin domain-containing protein [Candidatus Paceibacterota bacterium]